MQSKPLRPEQLQYLLTVLDTDYRKLSVAYRNSWSSAEDRESARQTLVGSVRHARDAVQSLEGTRDPEVLHLVRKLIVPSDLADDSCKHPDALRL